MNEQVLHMNKRDREDMKWVQESNVKKDLKRIKSYYLYQQGTYFYSVAQS